MDKKKNKKNKVEKLRNEVKQDLSDEIEKVEEGEVISKKKVIYIEIDDEIGSVYEKIAQVNTKHVYIVVPQRAVIFQSIVNLKILKRKAKEQSKNIYLITNDKNGLYLAQQAGIVVYEKAMEGSKFPLFSTEVNDEKLRITPLRASVNAIEEDTPTRLAEKKMSIGEILKKHRNNKPLSIAKINALKKNATKKAPRFTIVSPNRHALIGLVSVSLIVLLVIIYVALPGVTIYLTPAASVLEKSANIILADYQKNKSELDTMPEHMIASYPITVTTKKTIDFLSTGKKFSERSANASGKITIINTLPSSWPLIPQTRFQTKDGIVFRIADSIDVPAATNAGPGKVEVFVTADPVDASGGIVGERGNIGPSRFFLPGLRSDSQSKLYAESYDTMKGGITDYIAYVTPEDIEAAKTKLSDELIKAAASDLKLAVAKKNEITEDATSDYMLLEGENSVKAAEPVITIPLDLENKELKSFALTGEISASGVYYSNKEMTEMLKKELMLKKSPQKELVRVNEDSVTYRIFERDADTGKVKVTANIKGIEQYEIDPDKENGARLLNKIKDHILGKNIDEAKAYIQNLPEINKVEIKSWPMWSPVIPSIPDNIKFEIQPAIVSEL